jgi:hypothetical protein
MKEPKDEEIKELKDKRRKERTYVRMKEPIG